MAAAKKTGLGKGIDSMGIDALIPAKSRRVVTQTSKKEEKEDTTIFVHKELKIEYDKKTFGIGGKN